MYSADTVWALVILGLNVLAAVVSAWFARESRRMSARGDVDDLAITVERLAKATRRERMSAVRQAQEARTEGAPPELQIPLPATSLPQTKAQLRAKMRQMRGMQS